MKLWISILLFSGATLAHSQTIYTYYEQMPQFNGNLHQYIRHQLHYPSKARQQRKEGRVVVNFTVDTLGNILHPDIIRSTDTVFNNEALRIIKEMPPWKPGKNNGHPVNTTYTLPVDFQLDN